MEQLERLKDALPSRPSRPFLTARQTLFLKMGTVASAMILGSSAAVAGAVLLIISALLVSVPGIVFSSFSMMMGIGVTIAGYLWFTL